MKRLTFVSKLFLLMALLITLSVIVLSMAIFYYANYIVSSEIIALNNAVLNQASDDTSRVVSDCMSLCNKIAYDSKLIDFLESDLTLDETGLQKQDQMNDYVEGILTNFAWSQKDTLNLFDVSVIGYNNTVLATGTQKYILNDVMNNANYTQAFLSNASTILLNTMKNDNEPGIYRYAFQIVQVVRDNLTQTPYGFIIMDFSENVLYKTYSSLINNTKTLSIVDHDGIVQSSQDKRLVGTELYLGFAQIADNRFEKSGYLSIERESGRYLIFFNPIKGTSWYLFEELDIDVVMQPLQRIRVAIYILTLLFILSFIFITRAIAKKATRPIEMIRNSMDQVAKGNLEVKVNISKDDEFGQIAKSFNQMVTKISTLLMSIKLEERKKRMAELDFLKAQINPHFVYNVLSSIRFFVEMNKNDQAESMLIHFSRILRKTLSRSDEFITISDEIDTIKDYVELQKLRYSDEFTVSYDISPDILNCLIPTFILQPIIENSIFYSVGKNKSGIISIVGEKNGDKIIIRISDNGVGMSEEQITNAFNREVQINKVGLINVQERLQLYFGSEYGIKINSQKNEGTQVIMSIPAQEIKQLDKGIFNVENSGR